LRSSIKALSETGMIDSHKTRTWNSECELFKV
jgi:hypothetical protein